MAVQKRLKGKVALVTGASRGIGRAVAKALAAEGAHVVITARTAGALEELDDDIHAAGGTATLLTLDLSKFDRIDQLGPTLFQRWGKLDIFVATAGVLGPLSPLGHVSADAWQNVIDINLNANWRLVRTLIPLLQRSEGGRAVFVSSGVAAGDKAYWGPYAVSKAGVEALARTLAAEADRLWLARQHRQPWTSTHSDARKGLPRRGSGDAAVAGGRGAAIRLPVLARPDGQRPHDLLSGMVHEERCAVDGTGAAQQVPTALVGEHLIDDQSNATTMPS